MPQQQSPLMLMDLDKMVGLLKSFIKLMNLKALAII